MQQPSTTARAVVGTLVLGAGMLVGAGLGPGHLSAAAAACDGAGVTVVVDPGSLGGSVDEGCVAGGGGLIAVQVAQQAGFELDFVPGTTFVCRVDGRPGPDQESCGRTPPSDAYWALFWAEDAGSPWRYATLGATALTVPDGGLLGWRWQDGGERDEPPAADAPAGEPAGEGAVEPVEEPADEPASDEPGSDEQGSVPAWAAGGAVLLLAAAVGAVAWRRRRGA